LPHNSNFEPHWNIVKPVLFNAVNGIYRVRKNHCIYFVPIQYEWLSLICISLYLFLSKLNKP
jgi:hypothetical protein